MIARHLAQCHIDGLNGIGCVDHLANVFWKGKEGKECPFCMLQDSSYIDSSVWFHPTMQFFTQQHPRWIHEPEVIASYDGSPAFRVRFHDRSSPARLTVWLHRETFQTLTSIQE